MAYPICVMNTTASRSNTLRDAFRQLSALPQYCSQPNQLDRYRANEICKLFGDALIFCEREFETANRYGEQLNLRPDLRGNGQGMYSNAEALFFGYVYDNHYIAAREDIDDDRHGDY